MQAWQRCSCAGVASCKHDSTDQSALAFINTFPSHLRGSPAPPGAEQVCLGSKMHVQNDLFPISSCLEVNGHININDLF